jgi:hypothetical protein
VAGRGKRKAAVGGGKWANNRGPLSAAEKRTNKKAAIRRLETEQTKRAAFSGWKWDKQKGPLSTAGNGVNKKGRFQRLETG